MKSATNEYTDDLDRIGMLTASRVITTTLPIAEEAFSRSFASTGKLRARIGDASDSAIEAALVSVSPGAVAAARHSQRILDGAPGALYGALRELGDLSERISEVQEAIQGAAGGSDRQKALSDELNNLNELYSEAVQSKTFADARTALAQLEQNMSSGVLSGPLDPALRALLGDHVLSAARLGSIDTLQTLGTSLQRLSAVDPTQAGAAGTIQTLVDQALKAFSGPVLAADEIGMGLAEGKLMLTEAPQARQLTFAGASRTAIALKTLGAKDMVKAAAAHLDFDSQNVLMLIADPPEKDKTEEQEEQEKAEEKRTNRVNPRKVALFYGTNAPEAVAIDASTEEVVWSEER